MVMTTHPRTHSLGAYYKVFAFAHDLGTVGSTTVSTGPVVYAIGHVRDPAIQYITAGGVIQGRSLYFWSEYPTVYEAVGIRSFFLVSFRFGYMSKGLTDNLRHFISFPFPLCRTPERFQLQVFVPDYTNALARATALDTKVQADAGKISSEYGDVVALSIRQTLGAVEITISKDASGAWNTSDVMVFMNGQSQPISIL